MILINLVFKSYLDAFIIIFIDDILIYLLNEKHAKYLKIMLKTLKDRQLLARFNKYKS